MQPCRELSVSEMAHRIVRYIPELNNEFVCVFLRAYRGYGLYESQVSNWLRFFDAFVICGKDGFEDEF